jgi:alkaline phosphatase D
MNRREFLAASAKLVVVTATARSLIACDDSESSTAAGQDQGQTPTPDAAGADAGPDAAMTYDRTTAEVFTQGLASGDPRADSVILWTRVEPANTPDAPAEIPVQYEVATDAAFTDVVASGTQNVSAEGDHTLRLKVEGLSAYTVYFYRFAALGARLAGRTKTAPAADQDVPVKLAFASCQDFNGRYYHAWQWLAAQGEDAVDFVLFLGDYVYETDADPRFQMTTPDRAVVIPDGLVIDRASGAKAALTLSDYRSLYKTYRSDAHLQAVHAMFPFVNIWDDHEFADDSWQDHATHFNEEKGDEKDSARRQAADRAWFEYTPADPEYRAGAAFPDDIKIYRALRFGRHVELFLMDQRYFRDDHLIPEGPDNLDVGKTGTNSSLGSRNFVLKAGFDTLEAATPPSMLGAPQKAWLLGAVPASNATWKLLGSSTQMAQMLIDLSSFPTVPEMFRKNFYFSCDQWDGYRTERAEILGALADAGVTNLVSLAGDIHAFFAAELQLDFDAPADPVGVEFVCAGISSKSVQQITQNTVDGSELFTALGLGALVPQMDTILTGANPAYRYVKADANGIGMAAISADEIRVRLVHFTGVTEAGGGATAPTIVELFSRAGSNRIEAV